LTDWKEVQPLLLNV